MSEISRSYTLTLAYRVGELI